MLKRISVQQLTVGMHLKEFCGSWMEHPFWRTGFVLSNPKDIATILASSINEVWIDVSKGLDVPAGTVSVAEVESEVEVEAQLAEAAKDQRQTLPVSAAAEFERARKICEQSKTAVMSMFQEARMGKAVDAQGAKRMVQEISDSVARNPGALISVARLKTHDEYTYMHSIAVCALMIALGRQLKLKDDLLRKVGLAGMLHDLG